MSNKHLLNNKKIQSENCVELRTLEDNSIPLDLASELMIMSYNDKEPLLFIHVKDILKGNEDNLEKIYYNLVNQATNMNLMIDFVFNDCEKETILFFINKFYTNLKTIKYLPSIVEIVGDCILYKLNENAKEEYFLNKEIIKYLVENLNDYLDKTIEYLNSIPLFMLSSLSGFIESNSTIEDSSVLSNDEKNEEIKSIFEKHNIPIINDIDYLPKSIICLFYNSLFLTTYYSISPITFENRKYFYQQYNSYIYNGMNLFYYFSNENNIIFHILNSLNSTGENPEFLKLLNVIKENKNN